MKTMYGYRMLARSRGKYGRPNYPGRIKSSKSNFDMKGKITEQDIAVFTEPDDRMQELWKLIKDNVRNNISQVSFETWIEPCTPVSITDNKIVLSVENSFMMYMIEMRFQDSLRSAAEKVLSGRPMKVEVVSQDK